MCGEEGWCCTETGGDLTGQVDTITDHERAPDGNWQVREAEENCIDRLCGWGGGGCPERGH